VIDLSTQTLTFAADNIERACKMIEQAKNILAKVELMHQAETAKQR